MDLNIGTSGDRGIGASGQTSVSRARTAGLGDSDPRVIRPSATRSDSADGPPATIELHIEELVLHGFPASDRLHIGDAVQQELLRLVTEQGLPGMGANPVDVQRLNAGSFQVASGAKPQAIGAQLAQHLHRRLAPEQRPARPHRQRRKTR
jgi:hypothetical protein